MKGCKFLCITLLHQLPAVYESSCFNGNQSFHKIFANIMYVNCLLVLVIAMLYTVMQLELALD